MNKKWFAFNIFVLMFSSAGILFFYLLASIAPFIILPNIPKEAVYLGVAAGWGIAISLAVLSIHWLYHVGTKVTVVNKDEKLG